MYLITIHNPTLLLLIILSIRSYLLRSSKLSKELFSEALRNENRGMFEAAVIGYQSALNEANKTRFHLNLKNRIIEKLSLLNAFIEYNNNLRFIR